MPFGVFDPRQEFSVVWRHLPHWEQPGATYFITWRTGDSLPRHIVAEWLAERDEWLRKRGVPGVRSLRGRTSGCGATGPQAPGSLLKEYRSFVAERWESRLDRCYGECVLRRPELARVVADSLLHFDGDRYVMGDIVVMPNHVHLLVCIPDEGQLLKLCRSWKQYTAKQINRLLSRAGEFWQDESLDHLVRGHDEFEHFRRYIAENPTAAGLKQGEYLYHRAPDYDSVTA